MKSIKMSDLNCETMVDDAILKSVSDDILDDLL